MIEIDRLTKERCEYQDEIDRLREELALNAQMLARQCDLAREAEAKLARQKQLADDVVKDNVILREQLERTGRTIYVCPRCHCEMK